MSSVADITQSLAALALASNELQAAMDRFWLARSEAAKAGIHVGVKYDGESMSGGAQFSIEVEYVPPRVGEPVG